MIPLVVISAFVSVLLIAHYSTVAFERAQDRARWDRVHEDWLDGFAASPRITRIA